MKKCNLCGKTSAQTRRIIKSKTHGHLCETCYQRERTNPITYTIPKYGEVAYSPDGKPICHVCGKAYHKILAHSWQVHNLSAYDYKKQFGLETSYGIMSEESTKLARKRVYENYDTSIKENLLEKGTETRFKEGHEGRTKDQVSEQTRRELIRRIQKPHK